METRQRGVKNKQAVDKDTERLRRLLPATRAQQRLLDVLVQSEHTDQTMQQEAIDAVRSINALKAQVMELLPITARMHSMASPRGRETAVLEAFDLLRVINVACESRVAANLATDEEARDALRSPASDPESDEDGPGEPELAFAGIPGADGHLSGSEGPPRTPLILLPEA